jgi:hypothetical protein
MVRFAALPVSLALAFAASTFATQSAQSPFGDLEAKPAVKPAAVTYLFPEQITIAAGKPASVDLHFKVADGLHVNSHTPHDAYLIPTTFKLPDTPGVRVANATFPAGTDFAFPGNPQEKLSVYTGEFVVHAQFVAAKGDHLVQATLHYQACNNSTCMPPHNIPVAIDVIAK